MENIQLKNTRLTEFNGLREFVIQNKVRDVPKSTKPKRQKKKNTIIEEYIPFLNVKSVE